ncbi:MAG: hypothetical protein Q9208_006339 [Pyrenodesmia sp. 3 TL-2023]
MTRYMSDFGRGRWPVVPPGPYFDTNNDPQPTLTKDVAYILRQQSGSPVHSRIGAYVYSNCDPLHFFPNYEQDFALYLCAALAKHWSIRQYLLTTARCDYSSLSESYETVTATWHATLLEHEANGRWLTDTGKMDMIQLEKKLMVVAFDAYPCLLDLTYHMNSTALVNMQFDVAALKALGVAPGTTMDDMEHRFLCVRYACIYLLSTFHDISTLPDQFWTKFQATQGASQRNWGWLIRNHVRALQNAEAMLAKIEDAVDAEKAVRLIQGFEQDGLNRLAQDQGA